MRVVSRRPFFVLSGVVLVVVASSFAGVSAVSAQETNPSGSSVVSAETASDGSTLAAKTESDALAEAADSDKMVNVTSDTTEETTTWANPDGSFTAQEYTGPVRVADSSAASGWRDLDYTLVKNADGSIGPKSGYVPITLSGAATATQVAENGAARVKNDDGSTVTFGWNGALPEPTLSGNTATYTDVEPNMNIVIELTATGFEQYFVLTAPPTAPELDLVLPLSAPSLAASSDQAGGIAFSNADSKVVGNIAPGFVWDSRVDETSGLPSDEAQLGLSATSRALTVSSPASFFDDPDIQYPVTIDPQYGTGSSGLAGDTFVRSDFPTTTEGSYTPDELQVGTYNSGASVARSYLNISASTWEGSVITAASLDLYEFHSYNCTASTIKVEPAGTASSSTDWNNQPSRNTDTDKENTKSAAKGYSSSCPAGTVSITVESAIAYSATKSTSTIGLALVASETSDTGWKRFYSSNETADRPEITITYYHKPSVPATTIFSSPQRGCGTATSPVYVNNGAQDLTLGSTVNDTDPGLPMAGQSQIFAVSASGGTLSDPLAGAIPLYTTAQSATQTTTTAEPTANVNMPPIPANTLPPGDYAVQSETIAPTYHNSTGTTYKSEQAAAVSGYPTTYCYFVVKNSLPALPTVAVDGSASTKVGQPMTVKFSAPVGDGPAVFAYWWVDSFSTGEGPGVPVDGTAVGIATALPADGTGAGSVRYADPIPPSAGDTTESTSDITVAPPDVDATLWVAEFDGAGNVSTDPLALTSQSTGEALQNLGADPGVSYVTGHEWDVSATSGALTSPIVDRNTTSAITLTLGSTSPTTATANLTGFGPEPVLSFTGASTDTVTSASQVVDTTQPFSVSAFVQPNSVSTGVAEAAVSQAATGSGSAAFTLGMNSAGHYEFCVRPQLTPGAATCAVDSVQASTTSPQFIEGVWDPANEQIRLLETGSITPIATAWYALPTGETSATGSLLVGSDFAAGSDANEWKGLVTNPSIFPGVIDETQASNLAGSAGV